MKMNPEWKAKWLVALRSGLYEQGRRQLENLRPNGNTEYCCLGVLRELVQPNIDHDAHNDVLYLTGDIAKTVGLPETDDFDAAIAGENVQNHLGELNDGGSTFPQIADWIEKNL